MGWNTLGELAGAAVLRTMVPRCWPKVRHKSRGAAEAQLRSCFRDWNRATLEDGGTLNVYHCRFCEGWHIGHNRRGTDEGGRTDGATGQRVDG